MNIAFVTSSKIWSGVKTWMLEFGDALRRRGHAVHVIADDERFLSACWDRDLEVHPARFGPDYNPAAIFRFTRLLRRIHADIACMNLNKDLRTAGIAARLLDVPVVHRVGLVGDLSAKWDARMTQRFLVDNMLVTSHWLRNALLAAHPYLGADRVTAIYNGKSHGPLPSRQSRHDRVRFVVASRLAPDKNHLDLLEACARLKSEGIENFSVDVFGDGPMAGPIQGAIGRLGLGGVVRLAGFSAALATRIPAYDFGVLASRREALSNALLEFQAAGLPVIATRVGATPEVIRPGLNGYLFEPGDVPALTGWMRHCISMPPQQYDAMAEAAQQRVRQHFQIEKLAGHLEAHFRRVAEAAAGRQGEHQVESA